MDLAAFVFYLVLFPFTFWHNSIAETKREKQILISGGGDWSSVSSVPLCHHGDRRQQWTGRVQFKQSLAPALCPSVCPLSHSLIILYTFVRWLADSKVLSRWRGGIQVGGARWLAFRSP